MGDIYRKKENVPGTSLLNYVQHDARTQNASLQKYQKCL
mgnify:CR=1 FL=1